MDGFSKECEKKAARKREDYGGGDCDDHGLHRRTKSASERTVGASRGGASRVAAGGHIESQQPTSSKQKGGTKDPLHCQPDSNANTSSDHKATLEKDVEQLQLRLQQERSMRIVLERAIGRTSSTLSPGHRHFAAQTKELISEIESLEDEVANREQHVLSLYRSIFEQCASRSTSGQSSSVTSPAHGKQGHRKHPTIISNAFCSSKNFHLRPLQALITTNDSARRPSVSQSKSKHTPVLIKQTNILFERSYSNPKKVHEKTPSQEKTPGLRTLKEHLYQCPSKLSEEMVRCMATIYYKLHSAAVASPPNSKSPFMSRSSTNVLSQRGTGESNYGSCKSMVEISCFDINKSQKSRASYAIDNYRFLVEQLEKVNVGQMADDAQIAFWINVYNSLLMHAILAFGIPRSTISRLALFHKAAYNIGGNVISSNFIEHSVFGFHTLRTGRWLETILSAAMRKRYSDDKQARSSKFAIKISVPIACFALCTGALSDPTLRVYTSENVKDELELAKSEFLHANIVVKKSSKVLFPKVLDRFAKEASIASEDLLMWISENIDKGTRDSVHKCLNDKPNTKACHLIEWLPYNQQFRYTFSKSLTEKPWWG